MATKIFDKDFLDVMPLDEIKRKVNSFHPGSWHKVMIIDGSPITLSDGRILYITETFDARFGIKYGSMPHVAFKDLINLASTKEDVAKCRKIYNSLKHKEIVAKTAVEKLEHKEKLIASGSVLPSVKAEEAEDKKSRHLDCPAVVNCKNGSITLTFYATFRNKIKSSKEGFEFYEISPEVKYFVKDKEGKIFEIKDDGDEKIKKAMEKARVTARAVAKKKGGGVTPVFSPKVTNILNIW